MTATEECPPGRLGPGHVTDGGPCHRLYEHLTGTANRAAAMAAEFWCSEYGCLARLWHDLGSSKATYYALD